MNLSNDDYYNDYAYYNEYYRLGSEKIFFFKFPVNKVKFCLHLITLLRVCSLHVQNVKISGNFLTLF